MEDVQMSPSLRTKLKTKDAAMRIKNGSPKLQEVLRQRCRQRMRERRGQLFDRRRHGLMETDEIVHDTLTEIVRTELSHFASMDIDGKNSLLSIDSNNLLTEDEALALETEIFDEEQQWILMEYEVLRQEELAMAIFAEDSLREDVICPLCERGFIIENENSLTCPMCDFQFPLKASLPDFGKMIMNQVNVHSSICHKQPSFMLLPENNMNCLYLTCETCSTFALII